MDATALAGSLSANHDERQDTGLSQDTVTRETDEHREANHGKRQQHSESNHEEAHSTFFGLMPMILETSPQARFLIPMAISLGFGVLFATVIVLLLVPCLYLMVESQSVSESASLRGNHKTASAKAALTSVH